MHRRIFIALTSLLALALVFWASMPKSAIAQDETAPAATEEQPSEEELLPELPPVGGAQPPAAPAERIEGGAAGEGETRWHVTITGAVMMNYVFNDSPDSFTVKYRFEVKGQANSTTAVIRGDADISADVQGPLSKWPTGECRLEVTIPKVPFEMTFKRGDGEKGNIKLVFKKVITEDWQSKCTFTDAPEAHFDTRGSPELWLTKALDKARPPLKDIFADVGTEETTTRFVISKESLSDPPLGSGEIEGTGVITIKPGAE